MASGILGQSAPAADTNTTVYTVPGGVYAVPIIAVVNRGTVDAKVRIALAASAAPANAEFIEYDAVVPANGGVLERSAPIIQAAKRIVVRDDKGTCSYTVSGYERTGA